MTRLGQAKALALFVPAALLAGAYGSEIWGGLVPCEMCWWQRYAHFTAFALAVVALASGRGGGRMALWLAAAAIATSGFIGFYQAGVEAGYLTGFTQCTATARGLSADQLLQQVMNAPMVRCDEVQWSLLGISMAGWNGIVSSAAALAILWLGLGRRRMAA